MTYYFFLLYFQIKQDLAFHLNCLLGLIFIFLKIKKKKKKMLSAAVVVSTWRFKMTTKTTFSKEGFEWYKGRCSQNKVQSKRFHCSSRYKEHSLFRWYVSVIFQKQRHKYLVGIPIALVKWGFQISTNLTTAHTPISAESSNSVVFSQCTFCLLLYKGICCGYLFELHRLVQ